MTSHILASHASPASIPALDRSTATAGRRRQRLVLAPLALALALVAIVPGSAGATEPLPDAATVAASELAMVDALNADRTAAGLVPVRVDSRLMAIARARSVDMATKHYFSHTQPDGRSVFTILSQSGITWYGAGEIIAWNTYSMASTVSAANSGWMNSPGHHDIIVSTSYNYVGVGLAVDTSNGHKIWTAVFMKGPDRTGARATVARPTIGTGTTSTTRSVRVSWSGADVRLQVLTAGLRSFVVQRRVDGGAWATVWSSTTARSATFTWPTRHRYEVRVAAIDNNGNRGAWVSASVDLTRTVISRT